MRPTTGRAPREGKRHVLRWVAVGAVVILAAGTLTAYLKYRAVYDSITRVTVPGSELGQRLNTPLPHDAEGTAKRVQEPLGHLAGSLPLQDLDRQLADLGVVVREQGKNIVVEALVGARRSGILLRWSPSSAA